MMRRIFVFCLLFACCAEASAQMSREDTVSVVIIGDVMMHSAQLEHDSSLFLEEIRPWLESADFACANMEFTLGGEPYSGYPAFSAPDKYASDVRDCGIDVFLTANNHILDKGSRGLERTLGVYRDMGAPFTGSAGGTEEKESNYPLILRRKGISIALVNFTYGTNAAASRPWPAVNKMEQDDVAGAFSRAEGADFILALPHWGEEYSLTHSPSQEKWAGILIELGADAIIGSHPHVVQDTTHIGGVPVIYSIGNAVSNMSAANTRLELAVKIEFIKDSLSGETRMTEPELRFMWCTLPGRLTDGYRTIFIDEWLDRRDCWMAPSDYDNMIATQSRVMEITRIKQ